MMSTEVKVQQNEYIRNSSKNDKVYVESLKDLDTFKNERYCISSDSGYTDSSRSNSIDSEQSTEPSVYKSNIPIGLICSPTIHSSDVQHKNDLQNVDISDSGISSPICNFSDQLCSHKKEKSISFKERELILDLSPMDSSTFKNNDSKIPLRLTKLNVGHPNSSNISNIVNRIRSLSISMACNPTTSYRRLSVDTSTLRFEPISPPTNCLEIDSDPTKLPKEYQSSSINFTSKTLRNSRKWTRMTHSLSCDAESYINDFSTKHSKRNFKSSDETFNKTTNSPAQNRLEKYLSGHIDASTPSGALLKVINQGLRKVSESDRYLLFSKSPLRSPIDFLESGIEHLGDTEMLITVLHHSTCYDLMPDSGKLLVFDSKIQINKAFVALNQNAVDSAPVWCNDNNAFCGMLTKEDQIYFLSLAYDLNKYNDVIETHIANLSKETIKKCIEKNPAKHELFSVYPENTIASAMQYLQQSPYKKVLVIDELRSGNALFVLDHVIILSFLLNASKAGLPLPSVLKITIGVTELMSRKSVDKYQVFMETDMSSLLKIMNQNPHNCALVCIKTPTASTCPCNYECVSVITVDHISHLISTSTVSDPKYKVQSILADIIEIDQKVIWCTERDSVIDIINLLIREKASIALISPDHLKKCVHSIVSAKELLDYIMKHDRNRSSPKESVFAIDKTKCLRTISCCEDPQRNTDINLSEISLDEKDEDVFNMEML